jgi:ribonuclease P protein component
VLIKHANELGTPRIGVAAGRSVGNAVKRNRAKRVLRAAMRPLLPQLLPGYDILLLGRTRINEAKSSEVQVVLADLIKKAGLSTQI